MLSQQERLRAAEGHRMGYEPFARKASFRDSSLQ